VPATATEAAAMARTALAWLAGTDAAALTTAEQAECRADSYACIEGPGRGCGGAAIKAVLLEEYVTGAVLDALESPAVQEALRAGNDPSDTRRADLLADIEKAQQRRGQARRDYAEGVIDREDWLDIRDRTEQATSKARREYDRLAGSATVMSDIPPSEQVRDAWESWNVSRRRAAIKSVLHAIVIKPIPPGAASNPADRLKDPAVRRERELALLRRRVEFDWRA
jgi:hypothetical protein